MVLCGFSAVFSFFSIGFSGFFNSSSILFRSLLEESFGVLLPFTLSMTIGNLSTKL